MPGFAINTVLWTWPFTAEHFDLLKKIKDLGYDAVEFAIEDMSDTHLQKIGDEVKRFGLETIICGAFGPDRSIIDPDENIRKNGLKYIKDLFKVCGAVNAKTIVGPTYSVGIYDFILEPGGRKEAEKRFVESLKEIAPEAQNKNIRIAVEPLLRYESNFLNLGEDALRLIEQVDSPAVGLHLDPYHMNLEEASFAGPIKQAGNKLYHFHICENDRGTAGTGTINWDEIFTALKEINYEGYLSVESCDPDGLGPAISKLAAVWRKYNGSTDEMAADSISFLKTRTDW